jgi:hypothetical protein
VVVETEDRDTGRTYEEIFFAELIDRFFVDDAAVVKRGMPKARPVVDASLDDGFAISAGVNDYGA